MLVEINLNNNDTSSDNNNNDNTIHYGAYY